MMRALLVQFFLIFSFSFLAENLSAQCFEPEPPGTGAQACQNAPLFCSEAEFDGYCGNTYNSGVGVCPGPFCGSCENYQWFSFIANSTTIQLEIVVSNCQGTAMGSGMQAQMYQTGDCSNFTAVSNCWSPGNQGTGIVTATNLQIGQVYYLMLDGWAGDACDYTINVLQGVGAPPVPVIPGTISGVVNVCPGASVDYSVPSATGATYYDWTISPAIGSVAVGQGTENVTINWTAAGAAQLCVTPSNACETGPPVCVTVVSTPITPTVEVYDLCAGDVVVCQGTTYSGPGYFEHVYTSALGCDSIVYCQINLIPPYPPTTIFETLCAPDCYDFHGTMACETGGYTTTLPDVNGCDSTIVLILTVLEADAVIVPPPVLGCGGNATITIDGSQSTSTPASSEAVITYQWTGPAGGIVGPSDQNTVEVQLPGTYTLTVTQSANGVVCTDMASVTVTADTAVPDPPALSGPLSACTNTMETYTVTPAGTGAAPSGYTWAVTGGTFVDNGSSIDVTWTTAGTGQVCVTADNACGSSTAVCLDVEVGLSPQTPVIAGNTNVCDGDVIYYIITNAETGVTYNWTVGGGASFTNLGDSIQVDFDGAMNGDICVTATNSCGSIGPECVSVTVLATPADPVISGDAELCENGTGSYSVAQDPLATDYVWTTPNGETIIGQGTNSITVNWSNSSGGDVCVTLTNSCGSSQQNCFPVVVNPAPTALMSGGGSFCTGSTDSVAITIEFGGTGPWQFTYEIDGANPTSLTAATTPFTLMTQQPGAYTLTFVTDQTACVGSVSGGATVIENTLPTAQLSGAGAICQGSGDCVDLTVDLSGTAPWTIVPALDGIDQAPITDILSTPYTYQVCQAGTYTITSVQDANNCSQAGSGSVTIVENTSPIVSNIQETCDITNTMYTVSFEISGGDPATYAVNGSSAGISGGPPYIFTSTSIASGSGYSFQVSDANACDTVLVESPIVVCNCTSAVGTMDQTPLSACGTDCLTANYDNTGEVFDGNDALQFILHEGAGISIVNEIARNTTGEFCFDMAAGMVYGQTYYISAVVGDDLGGGQVDINDPCLAVAQGTPVTFYEVPTADLSGDQTICIGESASLTVNFTGPSPWTIMYDDGNNVDTLSGITQNPYTLIVSPTATAVVCLGTVSNAECDGTVSGCATVTVNEPPVVDNVNTACNTTSTAFTVSFNISGGDAASYQVLPAGSGTITPGNPVVFVSNEIPAGNTYAFQVFDANACDTIDVSTLIPVDCDCTTSVGEMDLTPVNECGDGPVTASYDPANQVLDGNDVQEFILHNGSGTNIGYPIIDRNTTGTFSFDPGTMSYGTTYYISAIAGSDDGTGQVDDQNDPCLAVAQGTPVTFYEVPTAVLSGDPSVCAGSTADLSLALTGDAPWTVVISDGSSLDTVSGINSTNYTYQVTPLASTTYTLLQVSDENCPGDAMGVSAVDVNTPPVPGAVNINYNPTYTGYVVCFDIVGGEPPYTVFNGIDTVVVAAGMQFCSQELNCGSPYNFEVDDANQCGPAIVSDPQVDCPCVTQAGQMDPTLIEICGSDTAVSIYDSTFQTLDANDVVDYILHNGDQVPIQINSVPAFAYSIALTYGQTYYISARVGNDNGLGQVDSNDPCLSISDGTPVVFREQPSATLSGGGDICAGECIDVDIDIAGGVAPWQVVLENTAGQLDTFQVMNSPGTIEVCPDVSTSYSVFSVSDAHCEGSGIGLATVSIQGVPFATNITVQPNFTNTMVTVCFDITGGDSTTYVVSGMPGTLSGSSFCSDLIPCSTDSYFFLVQDGFTCVTDTVQGPIECSCVSSAGIMDTEAFGVCEGELLAVPPAAGGSFDGNDAQMYVLHTSATNNLGDILAVDTVPQFMFIPGDMSCGETYYISVVVGDDDGTGFVDINDPCLSVSFGTPVVFECLPEVVISGNATICEGDASEIVFDLSSEGPYTIVVNNGQQDTILMDITDNFIWQVSPVQTTTYTLVSAQEIATGCTNVLSGDVTIEVNMPLTAGTALEEIHLCEGDLQLISLADLLENEDPGGSWTETSAVPSSGGAFSASAGTFNTANQLPGTYTFLYTVDALEPCTDDSETVVVVIDPRPQADAGDSQEISCFESEVDLGGPFTSIGNEYTYSWMLGTELVGTTPSITVQQGGTYVLRVENSETGCFSEDEVTVIESIDYPVPYVSLSDVSCFGDDDGFIQIDSIVGGFPPYLCSFNGGPFTQQKLFTNLMAGTYELVIQDSKGCEANLEVNLTQPEELTITLAYYPIEGTEIDLGDTVELTILLPPSYDFDSLDYVSWTPPELIPCDTCQTNMVAPNFTTEFSVMVAEGSCTAGDSVKIFVNREAPVYIPNAFSPNGDGLNDVFYIQAGQSVKQIRSFLVFNRWGEAVYEYHNFLPNDPAYGWDGSHRGRLLNPAVFTYYVEIELIDGRLEFYEGDVTLLR